MIETAKQMNFFVQHSELRDLYDKVAAGERISEADALRLVREQFKHVKGSRGLSTAIYSPTVQLLSVEPSWFLLECFCGKELTTS